MVLFLQLSRLTAGHLPARLAKAPAERAGRQVWKDALVVSSPNHSNVSFPRDGILGSRFDFLFIFFLLQERQALDQQLSYTVLGE